MTGSLVLEERTVRSNFYREKSNVSHVTLAITVLSSMLRPLQDNVTQVSSAIMVLTKDSLLEATEAMQVSVLLVTTVHREIPWHQLPALLAATITEHMLMLLKIARGVLEGSFVKKMVLLGLVAHVMLDTIA